MAAFLLALLLALQPTPHDRPQQPAAVRLSADSERRWVPFTLTPANHIRFEMRIAGTPATAILDTGVSRSIIGTALASRAKLAATDAGEAIALGGSVPVQAARVPQLTLGGLTASDQHLAVADLSRLPTGDGERVDALIGADLLLANALDIDFAGRRFRLIPSGRMPFRGTTAPLSARGPGGLFVTELALGKRQLKPVLVDTGDGSSASITHADWRASGLRNTKVTSTIAYGLGGPVVAGLTVTRGLRLGGQPTGEVEVRIEERATFARHTGIGSRIGVGLLQRYRVLLDPQAGHMLLASNGAPASPIRSTSGLLLGVDRDRLRVLHVMRGSPAARSGWREDDQICQVDAAPAVARPSKPADLRWSAGTPGRTIRLHLCDGTERRLTLASFY